MNAKIYLSAPDVGPLEESYLLRALRSGWVAPVGPEIDGFEREVADRVGVAGAVALSSGTAALHLGLLGLGAGPGTVVVVPTLTFVATANAVRYTGAEPVFVDCDPGDGNIDVDLLATLLKEFEAAGRRVSAVVPVDLFGSCADYARLLPVCDAAGVPVLEDAAEALGATRGGQPAGSFGHAGVLSFNGNKIVTTSGGGMLVSDDLALVERCRYLSTQARQPLPYYEHTETGYNYRLSNLLAAVGRAQVRRLDLMINRRRELRRRYATLFGAVPGVRLLGEHDPGANNWLTCIVVDPVQAGWQAAELATHLAAAQIETRPVWKPMHLQPAFAGQRSILTGVAERLFGTGLALPSGSGLTEPEIEYVLRTTADFLGVPA
ncbi:aminotransferase class I/II-fold pyridoxal phosphate-dependent enzyme [Micromonospora sp. WMMD1102]|uniref:aminotransferase class I/II-fold pyridoxal phosphate-dependent enzyme n=1 Tax=Micromonospora sp. WMMD1102 TaxID=3016105 RepID=UPI0024156769|nr:aminotransferase class I/II-fold pyridoxal phosphate-dependent enzyme [Micromonospora sp. WMMD1102]MDG4786397.1 aminotransferase class I/II-fold pyridoxal phosphate-dependent enzyme [Micromonospora sp. WMMD1102]